MSYHFMENIDMNRKRWGNHTSMMIYIRFNLRNEDKITDVFVIYKLGGIEFVNKPNHIDRFCK